MLIGIAGVVAGRYYALSQGFNLGVFLIGAGIALGGVEGVLTRRMPFRFSDDAHEAWTGAPAFLFGLVALVIGVAFIASAYLLEQHMWHATVFRLERDAAELARRLGWTL